MVRAMNDSAVTVRRRASPPFPDFAFACGEEGSDPLVFHDGREVRVDEFARSGHLDRMDDDLSAVAGLGVRVWRYGMPWRLTERAPGEYDWTLWDRALAACARHGLQPVVDLCHFGLPDHYPGFCDLAWVEGFGRYVDAFLARYREPLWFTPVNEPAMTAFASAQFGIWNDRRSSLDDFGLALAHCVLANLEALARIRADRDGWWVGAEGFACFRAAGDDEAREAERQRAAAQLVWDLHFGVAPRPAAEAALVAVPDRIRQRIDALVTREHVIAGHDFYPTSVLTVGGLPVPTIAERVECYLREARGWYERYGVPFWVAETSNLSLPVEAQIPWLETLVDGLETLRRDGLPVRGVCWYSRGDQYDWENFLMTPVGQVTTVGLFDTQRRPRPVAERFRELAGGGAPVEARNAE